MVEILDLVITFWMGIFKGKLSNFFKRMIMNYIFSFVKSIIEKFVKDEGIKKEGLNTLNNYEIELRTKRPFIIKDLILQMKEFQKSIYSHCI